MLLREKKNYIFFSSVCLSKQKLFANGFEVVAAFLCECQRLKEAQGVFPHPVQTGRCAAGPCSGHPGKSVAASPPLGR